MYYSKKELIELMIGFLINLINYHYFLFPIHNYILNQSRIILYLKEFFFKYSKYLRNYVRLYLQIKLKTDVKLGNFNKFLDFLHNLE